MPIVIPLLFAGVAAGTGYGILAYAEKTAGERDLKQAKQASIGVTAAGVATLMLGSIAPWGIGAWMLRAAGIGATVTGTNIWATTSYFERQIGNVKPTKGFLAPPDDGYDEDTFLPPPVPEGAGVDRDLNLPSDRRAIWNR